MKLKILDINKMPKEWGRRVVLEHDTPGSNEWVREHEEMTFLLWSNSRNHHGDMVYDKTLKRRVEVESPYEEVLDEDGYGTGEYKLKDGLIAFPVDVYEHSGTAWALSGEGGACFSCPWDTARGAFVLYTDEERWNSLCGNCKWEFVDGKPTEELLRKAREVARSEIRAMNMSESDEYYGYRLEEKTVEESDVVITKYDGTREATHRREELWDETDSCWGYLTENPEKEVEFPAGVPVVTTEGYLVGKEFEQECWAFMNEQGFLMGYAEDGKREFVNNVDFACKFSNRDFLDRNIAVYEKEAGCKLTVVDITRTVWERYPECIVEE